MEQIMETYTDCYQLYIDKNLNQVEQIHKIEMDALESFIQSFHFTTIDQLLRQLDGFIILVKWFTIMFHHINRTHNICNGSDHHLMDIIGDVYIDPNMNIILSILRDKWRLRDGDDDELSFIMEKMRTMFSKFYGIIHEYYILDTQEFFRTVCDDVWRTGTIPVYIRTVLALWEDELRMKFYFTELTYNEMRRFYEETICCKYYHDILYDEEYGWIRNQDADMIVFLSKGDRHQWLQCHVSWIQKDLEQCGTTHEVIDCLRRHLSICNNIPDNHDFINVIFTEMKQHFTFNIHHGHSIVRLLDIALRKKESIDQLELYIDLIRIFPDQDEIHRLYRLFFTRRVMDLGVRQDLNLIRTFEKKMGISQSLTILNMIQEFKTNVYREKNVQVVAVSKVLWDAVSTCRFPSSIMDVVAKYRPSFMNDALRLEMSSLGTVILKGRFDREYEFIMSPEQATVLLACDQRPMTADELREDLVLPHAADICAVLAISNLLVSDHHNRWAINNAFRSDVRQHRIKSTIATIKISTPITTNDVSTIDMDHRIDSMIVRLMKRHKKMLHNNIVVCVGAGLHYENIRHIKNRIHSLIERDFIERDGDCASQYNYLP